jgi:putative membrane-bound dehydrogenase-like protein
VRAILLILLALLGSTRAQSDFVHPPEIEITLFAKEPDVVDPVAICFAANGDAYVVEMRDYPYGIDGKGAGTIRLLRDTDNDGRADYSKVFAKNLSYPTSVTPWRNGILVAAPPQVLFLADTDGDDIADERKVILDGFKLGVTDGNFSALQWGIDNQMHGAKGGSPAKIHSPLNDQAVLPLGDRDFSFDPDTGHYAPSAGAAAGFGLTSDPYGRWFANYNVSHLKLRVIPWRYMKDKPWLPDFPTTVNISDHGESARIFPISEAETRPNHPEQAGHFTSASGMLFIPEGSFHESLDNTVLTMDVVANLVHRDVIIPDGPIFKGGRHPDEHDHDFIASHDKKFRPTDIEFGPDGALYLLDMHRDVIEHPDYIPDNLKEKLDLRGGDQQGRIYRITPRGKELKRTTPVFSSSDPWAYETAHRLQFENRKPLDPSRPEPLVAPHDKPQPPSVRARRLWMKANENRLSTVERVKALSDPHLGVLENALILAKPTEAEQVIALTKHKNPRVRFQAALTLGSIGHPDKTAALAELLVHDADSTWTRRAILTATRGADLLLALPPDFNHPAAIEELAHLAAASNKNAAWLKTLEPSAALLSGLHSGWRSNGHRPKDFIPTLDDWARLATPATTPAILDLLTLFERAQPTRIRRLVIEAELGATNPKRSTNERLNPIALLGKAGSPRLFDLLSPKETSGIQRAALNALRECHHRELGREIIARWPGLSPLIRREAIDTLLSDQRYHQNILDGLEKKVVTHGELNLDLEQRRTLLRWSTPSITARAKKIFPDEEYINRKDIVVEWLKKLPEQGDREQGKLMFTALCSVCHIAGGIGFQVGPDLTSVSHRSVEDLATHILDPNMAINPKYISTSVQTRAGQRFTGILVAEDELGVTLLLPAAARQPIPRKEIKSIRTESRSLMPEGLEAAMDPKKLRDLIEFLQARPAPTGH